MAAAAAQALWGAGAALAQAGHGSIFWNYQVARVDGTATCGIDLPRVPDPDHDLRPMRRMTELDGRLSLVGACQALKATAPQDCPLLDPESLEVCMTEAHITVPPRWAAMRSPSEDLQDLVPTAGWHSQRLVIPLPRLLTPRALSDAGGLARGESSGATTFSYVYDCAEKTAAPAEAAYRGWEKLPFVLRTGSDQGACGATQLASDVLLTAAHCLPAGWRKHSSLQLTLIQGNTRTSHTVTCRDHRPPWNATVVCRAEPALPCPTQDPSCHVSGVVDGRSLAPGTSGGAMLVLGWNRAKEPQAYCVGPGSGLASNKVTRTCDAPSQASGEIDLGGKVSLRCSPGTAGSPLVYVAEPGDSGMPTFATCDLGAGAAALMVEGVVQRIRGGGSTLGHMTFTDYRCSTSEAAPQ